MKYIHIYFIGMLVVVAGFIILAAHEHALGSKGASAVLFLFSFVFLYVCKLYRQAYLYIKEEQKEMEESGFDPSVQLYSSDFE